MAQACPCGGVTALGVLVTAPTVTNVLCDCSCSFGSGTWQALAMTYPCLIGDENVCTKSKPQSCATAVSTVGVSAVEPSLAFDGVCVALNYATLNPAADNQIVSKDIGSAVVLVRCPLISYLLGAVDRALDAQGPGFAVRRLGLPRLVAVRRRVCGGRAVDEWQPSVAAAPRWHKRVHERLRR